MRKTKREESIELLKEYYEFDEANKVFTIPISFDKASDILDLDVIDPKNHPMFKKEVMERVKDTLMGLPAGYKADIDIRIDDYEGYDASILLSAFNKAIRLNQQRSRLEQRRSGVIAAVLALIGFLVLFIYIFGRLNGWFGEEEGTLGYDFVTEVLDIVAWVFIWEAVSFVFLYENDYRSINAGLLIKINVIGFYDKTGKIMKNRESLDAEMGSTLKARRYEPIGKNILLFSSTVMITFGAFLFLNRLYTVINMPNLEQTNLSKVVDSFGIGVGILSVIVGLGGMNIYADKAWKKPIMIPLLAILGVGVFTYAIMAIMTQELTNYSSGIFSLVMYIFFVVGYIFTSLFGGKKM